jgi:hypothetical protein
MRTGNAIIPIDEIDKKSLGLREQHPRITNRQHELVATLLHDGCTITSAAETMDANRTWACKTLNKQHVIEYMHQLAKNTIGAHSLKAIATMDKLLSAKSDHVRLEAAKDLMDRAGLVGDQGDDKAPPLTINISL